MASDVVAAGVNRRQYPNPPVHEVILDSQFQEPFLTDKRLEELKTATGNRFGVGSRAELIELRGGLGVSGSNIQGRTQLAGWDFTVAEPRWLLRAYRDRLTLHLARPGDLPEGKYLGWESVRQRYQDVHAFMVDFYGDVRGRRVALRYLNRIVLPTDSDLQDWFEIAPPSPAFLGDTYAFHFARTWATVHSHPRFSATVRLAKLEMDPEQLPPNTYPVLLDVEVFNLRVREAPTYDNLLDWYEEAHKIENDIFESSINDRLRERFA